MTLIKDWFSYKHVMIVTVFFFFNMTGVSIDVPIVVHYKVLPNNSLSKLETYLEQFLSDSKD